MQSTTIESRERFSQRGLTTNLKRVWGRLDTDNDGKINFRDVMAFLKDMGYKATKVEVQEMLWEVDENNDGRLDWTDFEEMFRRCSQDRAGIEPRQLYNVVLFALQDIEGTGYVTMEQATVLMHLRYGRESLDRNIAAVFSQPDAKESNQRLTLTEFVNTMNKLVAKQAKETSVKRG